MKKLLFIIVLLPLCVFAQNTNFNTALLAYYDFEGDAKDKSGNENHGTIYSGSFSCNTFGLSNSVIAFDGIEDRVEIANIDYSIFSEQTISLWLITQNLSADFNLLEYANVSRYPWTQYEVYYKNNEMHYHVRNTNQKDEWVSAYVPMVQNQMSHIVLTKDKQGLMSIYFNGELIKSVQNNIGFGKTHSSFKTTLGASYGEAYSGNFKGSLDNVRLYNKALSLEEVSALFREEQNAQDLVIYKDKQLAQEDSFTLLEVKAAFNHYAYCEATHHLFLLTPTAIMQYDLNKKDQKPITIELDFKVDTCKFNNGIRVNKKGSLLALIDQKHNLRIIDVNSQAETNKIKIKKKLFNFESVHCINRVGNPFVFTSNNKVLIAGSKYAGIINVSSGKTILIRLKGSDWHPATMVSSSRTITKLTWDKGAITYSLNGSGYKKESVFEDNYNIYISTNSKKYIRNKQSGKKQLVDHFMLSDKNELAYYSYNPIRLFKDTKQMKIQGVSSLDCIHNSTELLAIKEGNKGFVIYDYKNIEKEMEKQFFIKASEINTSLSYDDFKKLYPKSSYLNNYNQELVDH
ncbi:MAG: hypothetical protein B7C24_14130 [Bacteroidetes bacterium 4572_77]|nr:MAG: hypothetical protein B7C24_14130 [Bacteroidetes bacterium 4572_77]